MSQLRPPGFFITGTDTGVGKTRVTARIARSLVRQGCRVGVYKPAASGGVWDGERWRYADPEELWEAAGRPRSLGEVCPQCFPAPLAPHLAAQAAGQPFDTQRLRSGIEPWLAHSDVVLVEGAGGFFSPLGADQLVADLACDLAFPLIVVAPDRLGTINQTLQTTFAIAHYRGGQRLAGVVLNELTFADPQSDPSVMSNGRELARRLPCPLLARLAFDANDFDPPIDWRRVAQGE